MAKELWLIRHGETEWSLSGAHTGRTDIPLTAHGAEQAVALGALLAGQQFALVLTSPLERARRTADLAGLSSALPDPDLMEWNYGRYEGRTTAEIRREQPDWELFRDGAPEGETIAQVAARAESAIARASAVDGVAAIVAHGHLLRILTACWLGLPPEDARLFALSTASLSVLGYEHAVRVINR